MTSLNEETPEFSCEECLTDLSNFSNIKYCPNCGASVGDESDGDEDETDD